MIFSNIFKWLDDFFYNIPFRGMGDTNHGDVMSLFFFFFVSS